MAEHMVEGGVGIGLDHPVYRGGANPHAVEGGVAGHVGDPRGPQGSVLTPTPSQPRRTSQTVPTRVALVKNPETGKMGSKTVVDKSAARLQAARPNGFMGRAATSEERSEIMDAQQAAINSAGRGQRPVVTVGQESGATNSFGSKISAGAGAETGLGGIRASTAASALSDSTISANQEAFEARPSLGSPLAGPPSAAFQSAAKKQVAAGFANGASPSANMAPDETQRGR